MRGPPHCRLSDITVVTAGAILRVESGVGAESPSHGRVATSCHLEASCYLALVLLLHRVSVSEQPGLRNGAWPLIQIKLPKASLLPKSSWALFTSPAHCVVNALMATLEPM